MFFSTVYVFRFVFHFALLWFGFIFAYMQKPGVILRAAAKVNLDKKLKLNNSKGISSSARYGMLALFKTSDVADSKPGSCNLKS